MPEIIYGEQGTEDWKQLRIASIGGTAINRIAPMKDGYKKALYEFVGEMVSGVKADNFKFRHADRGILFEPKARSLYEFIVGVDVEQVSMIKGDKPHQHYSPDGLIGEDGLLEIKVRIPSVWIELAEGGLEPIADRRQRQWGLHICQKQRIISVNYCPEIALSGNGGILIKRVERDEKMIAELEAAADRFIKDMLELSAKYKQAC